MDLAKSAAVVLTFLLPNGLRVPIEFVIDTGFTGEPSRLLADLFLNSLHVRDVGMKEAIN